MKIRIFVIDDEKMITDLFVDLFDENEYEVIVSDEPTSCMVYNGSTCKHEYACGDILFVDKDMPNMNGLEFIEHMDRKGCKGLTKNKVLMSGNISEQEEELAKELGCRVLHKPVSIYTILSLVEEMKKSIPLDRRLEALSSL
jgi:CheY-like chemotaxis protein